MSANVYIYRLRPLQSGGVYLLHVRLRNDADEIIEFDDCDRAMIVAPSGNGGDKRTKGNHRANDDTMAQCRRGRERESHW